MELWEYNEEPCEAPFLLTDQFDIYCFDIVGNLIQMHIVDNILCDHWGMHQYPDIPFQFLLEWKIIIGMCEVTYLVMVRNIHLSTYNNNIQKEDQ
jgi:hypothetical protein